MVVRTSGAGGGGLAAGPVRVDAASSTGETALGLGPNALQFAILTVMTLLVGMTIGVERVVLPPLAHQAFGVSSLLYTTAFLSSFGAMKALTNLVAGRWSDRFGRRRLMLMGWLVGLPYPVLIIFAHSWLWVIAANLFLGVNQGLTWSMSVTAKIDLVGPKRRGLAVGIDESSGYVGTALGGYLAALLAAHFGLRPDPYYLALLIVLVGGALTIWPTRETLRWAHHESLSRNGQEAPAARCDQGPTFGQLFRYVSIGDRALGAASQAGLVNKIADSLIIVLMPLWLLDHGHSIETAGLISAVYAGTWGVLQVPSGHVGDLWGRKWLIALGLVAQGGGLIWFVSVPAAWSELGASAAMGIATAALYPNLLTVVGDVADPRWRGSALGVYRLWRDGGYAVGPMLIALVAGTWGMTAAFVVVACMLVVAGVVVAVAMYETAPGFPRPARTPSMP